MTGAAGTIASGAAGGNPPAGSEAFERTAAEYDLIVELSYAWYYSRIHALIAREVIRPFRPREVLDLGCGTGFQSYLHGAAGASAVGVDVAPGLMDAARRKSFVRDADGGIEIFSVHFDFVRRYNGAIADWVGPATVPVRPTFCAARAGALPFQAARFDHINMVGTLSYLDDGDAALAEISRVLRPGGTAFIEVESRWSLERLWQLVAWLRGSSKVRKLAGGNGEALGQLLLRRPFESVTAAFPFNAFGEITPVRSRYYTATDLKRRLAAMGLRVRRRWPIHSATNLIPWSRLDRRHPSRRLRRLFSILAAVEEWAPWLPPGIGMAVLAEKTPLDFRF